MFNFPQILWLFLPPHSDLLSTFYFSHDFCHIRSCSVSGTMTLTLTRSQALGIHLLGAFMPLCSGIWQHSSHFYHFGHQNDEHTMNIHSLGKGYKERILQKINLCIWFFNIFFLMRSSKAFGPHCRPWISRVSILITGWRGHGGRRKDGLLYELMKLKYLENWALFPFFHFLKYLSCKQLFKIPWL